MTTATAPSQTPSQPTPPPKITDNVPAWVGVALIIAMLIPFGLLAYQGTLPAPTSIDGFKQLINLISVPQLSLPFLFLPLFILMLVYYRRWTKPAVFWPMLLIFCVVYFGSMSIDKNYRLILQKADNVPITMMLLGTLLCLWIAFRQAAMNDSRLEAGLPLADQGKDDKTLVWPDLVYTEMLCLVIASAILVIWAVVLPAPLESPANPLGPPNPSKAPWYFLGLQEMLVYFDPWMAGVLLPGLIVVGLIAMPYIDTNPKGNGYYTLIQRKFSISIWLFGFLILWVVLIIFGTFLRGPNWNFFGPYQYWDPHRQVPLTNINLSEYWYVFLWKQALPANPLIREWLGILLTFLWIFILPVLLALTVFKKMYREMGFGRYIIMATLFIFMAMLPLKMVLRWLFVLKYFIYLPEYNLNL